MVKYESWRGGGEGALPRWEKGSSAWERRTPRGGRGGGQTSEGNVLPSLINNPGLPSRGTRFPERPDHSFAWTGPGPLGLGTPAAAGQLPDLRAATLFLPHLYSQGELPSQNPMRLQSTFTGTVSPDPQMLGITDRNRSQQTDEVLPAMPAYKVAFQSSK